MTTRDLLSPIDCTQIMMGKTSNTKCQASQVPQVRDFVTTQSTTMLVERHTHILSSVGSVDRERTQHCVAQASCKCIMLRKANQKLKEQSSKELRDNRFLHVSITAQIPASSFSDGTEG